MYIMNANANLSQRKERGKIMGKNPPPKREMIEDAWMDGVIKTPPLRHTSGIYNRE